MNKNSEEYALMREKALSQLRNSESLTGKDGAFGPLLKEFLEAALDGEMSSHLDDSLHHSYPKPPPSSGWRCH